jgi:hypothetical protein
MRTDLDPMPLKSFRGMPDEIGRAIGRSLRGVLAERYDAYLRALRRTGMFDFARIEREALEWLEGLPARYRDEVVAIAVGAELSLLQMARCLFSGWAMVGDPLRACTSLVVNVEGRTWIAHNNDWFDGGSRGWIAATAREIPGRRSTLSIGLDGDACVLVGVNDARLWIQLDGWPADDVARDRVQRLPSAFLAREALETCASIEDVAAVLSDHDRTDGMAFFVVDGKTEEMAVFECTRATVRRREPIEGTIVASCSRDRSIESFAAADPDARAIVATNLRRRIDRLQSLWSRATPRRVPDDLAAQLADPEIEDVSIGGGTLWSNVACPSTGESWCASGVVPAASNATWKRVPWPW